MRRRLVVLVAVIGLVLLSLSIYFIAIRDKNVASPDNTKNSSIPNSEQAPGSNTQQSINHYFVVGSMVPGYSMMVNDSKMVQVIENLNVYGRSYISTGSQTTGKMPLETVQVIIKEKDGIGENLFSKDVYIKLIPSTILIDIIVNKKQLEDPNIQQQILEKSLRNIYQLVYKDSDEKQVSQAVKYAISGIPENTLVIKKK